MKFESFGQNAGGNKTESPAVSETLRLLQEAVRQENAVFSQIKAGESGWRKKAEKVFLVLVTLTTAAAASEAIAGGTGVVCNPSKEVIYKEYKIPGVVEEGKVSGALVEGGGISGATRDSRVICDEDDGNVKIKAGVIPGAIREGSQAISVEDGGVAPSEIAGKKKSAYGSHKKISRGGSIEIDGKTYNIEK